MSARRSWTIGVLMVLAAFAGGFTAQVLLTGRIAHAQEPGQVIRAKGFILVDDAGRERGGLSLLGGIAPAFAVADEEGNRRLLVGELDDSSGWGMRIYDRRGMNRFTAGLWEGVALGMRIFDPEGTKRLGIGFSADGENGGVALIDGEGQERLGMGMGPGGSGDFVAKDALGNDTWRALGDIGPPALP